MPDAHEHFQIENTRNIKYYPKVMIIATKCEHKNFRDAQTNLRGKHLLTELNCRANILMRNVPQSELRFPEALRASSVRLPRDWEYKPKQSRGKRDLYRRELHIFRALHPTRGLRPRQQELRRPLQIPALCNTRFRQRQLLYLPAKDALSNWACECGTA